MKPALCFLLPIQNAQELQLFSTLPLESLLCPGNLQAARESFEPVFCVLAPSTIIAELEGSRPAEAIGRLADLRFVSIDDLVVDYPFDVLPSLIYMKGMSECGCGQRGTRFVFLEPDLVMNDGAIRSICRRLAGRAEILSATYLRADCRQFAAGFASLTAEDKPFAARSLVKLALANLDLRELASTANLELELAGPIGRVLWKQDTSTLLGYDFIPSLVALRPSREVHEAPGFCDVAFAPSMCPGGVSERLVDSDEFTGIKLVQPASGDAFSARRGLDDWARKLAANTEAAQRSEALRHPIIFHAGDLPGNLLVARTKASALVRRLMARMMKAAPVGLQAANWMLCRHLWEVRRFELGRGSPPTSNWLQVAQPAPGSGAPPAKLPALRMLGGWARDWVVGRPPLVTFFHPLWLEYRQVQPLLRSAVRARGQGLLYVADGSAVLSKVLGTPSMSSANLERSVESGEFAKSKIRFAVVELSPTSIGRWSEIVSCLIPAVTPTGRIVVFFQNAGHSRAAVSYGSMALGWSKLNMSKFSQFSMSGVRAGEYTSWLRTGYVIALGSLRSNRILSVMKGAGLLAMLTVLTLLANLSHVLLGRAHRRGAVICSSVTIAIEV